MRVSPLYGSLGALLNQYINTTFFRSKEERI